MLGTAIVPGSVVFSAFSVRLKKKPLTLDHQNNVRSLVPSTRSNRMKTSTQVYRELKAVQFTEPQAKALVEILQAGGIVESGAIEGELQRIEDYVLAEPFEPFAIEITSGTIFRIEQPAQCRFTRHGLVRVLPGDGHFHILNSEHIVRVQKMPNRQSETHEL
jgi:hypothetical protein